MAQQYLRAGSLVLTNASGAGLDLSQLRVTFSIQHGCVQTPQAAMIRVYNPAPATIAKAMSEFTAVSLSAGYVGNVALIFTGTIKLTRAGRENPTDTFLDIFAAHGDEAYNQAGVNVSLTKGWTDNDILAACLKSFAPFGVTRGSIAPLNSNAAVRGCTLFGDTKTIMRELAFRNGCSWNIDQGRLNLIATGQPLIRQTAVVLNANSGLVGIPHQTPDGVDFTALLNPQIRPGTLVQIAKADVLAATPDFSYVNLQQSKLPAIAAAGTYVVIWTEFEGDTRGDPWYTHGVCTSYNPSDKQPQTDAVREAIAPF